MMKRRADFHKTIEGVHMTAHMTKVVTFGETMAQYNARFVGEFKARGEYMADCAGAESNMAVNLGRLGVPGVEAVWVSRMGDDDAGRFALAELEGRVGVAAPAIAGEKTGISYLNHHADGSHIKTYFRKGSAASRLTFAEVEPHLGSADALHVTGITPALSDVCRDTTFAALAYAADKGIPVSFDLNYREQLWQTADARDVYERMAAYAAVFKLGHDEAQAVWGKAWSAAEYARHFQGQNGGVVVVTRGADGAVAFDGANFVEHPGYRVDAVDPVGAGDAFVAGLLAGILERCDLRAFLAADAGGRADTLAAALRLANACGALTCTRRGDTAAMPSRDEARRFSAARGG